MILFIQIKCKWLKGSDSTVKNLHNRGSVPIYIYTYDKTEENIISQVELDNQLVLVDIRPHNLTPMQIAISF